MIGYYNEGNWLASRKSIHDLVVLASVISKRLTSLLEML